MQTDVKVFTPELLVDIFPDLTVKVVDDVFKRYNLHTCTIDHIQLVKLARIQEQTNVNLTIRRYNKGLTINFSLKESNQVNSSKVYYPLETIRDYFELVLPQEARIFAFENTSKLRLDYPAKNLSDAILQSFYISDTPQGSEYWQDVILNNS